MLEIQDLSKNYGKNKAVDPADRRIYAGNTGSE